MPEFSRESGVWSSAVIAKFIKQAGSWSQMASSWLKDAGIWKQTFSSVEPVNIRFDVYGGQGQKFGINNNGQPPQNDPRRQGGKGGYTRVDMVIPTAYVIEPYNFPGGPLNGGGYRGGSGIGFAIDGEWMVVAGGGGGAAGYYDFRYGPPAFFLALNGNGPGGPGSGGYNNSGSSGSVGGGGGSRVTQGPDYQQASEGGSSGGGAPGGPPRSPGQAGQGGSGNIRIWRDQAITSGTLNVNPDWTMTYVTSSNGTSTSGRVVITNKDTGGSTTLSGNLPVKDISNL